MQMPSQLHTISPDEISIHNASFCDDFGQLFAWGGRLFRGLYPAGHEMWNRLNELGIVQDLIASGLLVETKPADITVPGYSMVVEHRKLPYVSYAAEWCPSMLRDAALTVLDIQIRLLQYEMVIADPNPWNILFDHGRPVYIDLGSIMPMPEKISRRMKGFSHFFQNYFINPLAHMSYGHDDVARALSRNYNEHVTNEAREAVRRGRPFKQRVKQGLSFLRASLTWRPPSKYWATPKGEAEQVRDERRQLIRWQQWVTSLQLPQAPSPAHAQASANKLDLFGPYPEDLFEPAVAFLRELKPKSVTRLAGSMPDGLIDSETQVAVIEESNPLVEHYYNAIKTRGLPILPVMMSLRNPTPQQGAAGSEFAAAEKRFRSDIAIALGSVFDMFNYHELTFDQIAATISPFCERGLLVDFTSLERRKNEIENRNMGWDEYRLDLFQTAIKKHFRDVSVVYAAEDGTTLLWCKKRSRRRDDKPTQSDAQHGVDTNQET